MLKLNTESLQRKHGFSDGDIIGDYLDRKNVDLNCDEHQILFELVVKYLMPLLPGFELEFVNSCHNPCRVYSKNEVPDISVDVTFEQVMEIVNKNA